ncbi:hypothetical protein V2G26_002372 [Clonostachys chloroleuca]
MYTTKGKYSAKILQRGTDDYERCRSNNPSAATPERYPHEIHVVETTEDVSKAIKRASELGVSIGVRSSGHIFSLGAIVDDGIMIDTTNLNREAVYDRTTQEIHFGPAVRVEEISAKLASVKRFFPHGHAPTVAAGGFLLAGGQGWFVRGWGATSQTWITKMEIVVPDGRVVTASRTENRDLFWAARGSGLAFFGVVTKFWARTMRASNLWDRSLTFELGDKYEELMTWAFESGNKTPQWGTDLNMTIFYPEKYDPTLDTDEIPANAKLHMGLSLQAYADTKAQASILLSAYDDIPPSIKDLLVEVKPLQASSFEHIYKKKRGLIGSAGQRWSILSMLNEPSLPLPQLIKAVKPALCELPTRLSSAFMCICDIKPDEDGDALLSMPQQYYISTITQWKDPGLEPDIYQHMRDRYKQALPAACGIYVADYDVTCDDSNGKVMSDVALEKFLKIRQRWDPQELFPNYKKIIATHHKVNNSVVKAKM